MCLIVFKENDKSVFTNRQFKYMINNNADGLGIMWREDGRVKFEKTLGTPREKFKLFQKHRTKRQYAMHARIKTHGLIDEINCHPYEILNMDKGDPIDLYMMHNGMIKAAPEIDKDKSDTWHYVEHVLKPMIKAAGIDLLWENEYIQDMVAEHIGYSKLLFMRSDAVKYPVLLINAKMGTEKDGCWLSNTSSEPSVRTTTVGYGYGNYNPHGYNNNWKNDDKKKSVRLRLSQTKNTGNNGDTATNDDALNWDEYCEQRYGRYEHLADGYYEKVVEDEKGQEQGRLFLPDNSKCDKIVELKDFTEYPDNDPNAWLREQLTSLRGMSSTAIKDFVRNDPDVVADIIMGLYDKNTMPYETIISQCKDEKGTGLADITDLLLKMTYSEGRKQHCR